MKKAKCNECVLYTGFTCPFNFELASGEAGQTVNHENDVYYCPEYKSWEEEADEVEQH